MAKYHASPFYTVGVITFDYAGNYETDVTEEITLLETLVPVWIKRQDSGSNAEVVIPAPKPRRSSAK